MIDTLVVMGSPIRADKMTSFKQHCTCITDKVARTLGSEMRPVSVWSGHEDFEG